MRRLQLGGARVFGVLMILLGVGLVASTLARGGGPLALGVVLGTLFVALGAGRLLLTRGLDPSR